MRPQASSETNDPPPVGHVEAGKIVELIGADDPVRGFVGEIEEVVRSLQSGEPSSILSGDLARDAIVLCHKQSDSVKQGSLVQV